MEARTRTLSIDRNNPEQARAFDHLFNLLLDHSAESKSVQIPLTRFLEAMGGRIKNFEADKKHLAGMAFTGIPPLGKLAELDTIVQGFVTARDASTAGHWARELGKWREKTPFSAAFLKLIDLPTFAFPDVDQAGNRDVKKNPPVAWNTHVGWSEKDEEIARALIQLGVQDHRVFAKVSNEVAADVLMGKIQSDFQGPHEGSISVAELKLSSQGRLVKVDDTHSEAHKQKAFLFHAKAMEHYEALVEKTLAGDPSSRGKLGVLGDALWRLGKPDEVFKNELKAQHLLTHDPSLFFDLNRFAIAAHKELQNKVIQSLKAIASGKSLPEKQILHDYLVSPKGRDSIDQLMRSHSRDHYDDNARPRLNDPLLQFIISNPSELLSPLEQSEFLAKWGLLERDLVYLKGMQPVNRVKILPEPGQPKFAFDHGPHRSFVTYEKLYQIERPQTWEDVLAVIEKLGEKGPFQRQLARAEADAFSERNLFPSHLVPRFIKAIHTKLRDPDYREVNRKVVERLLPNRLRFAIARMTEWPKTLQEKLELWGMIQEHGLFASTDKNKDKVLHSIMDEIEKLPSPLDRISHFQKIIGFGHLSDVSARKRLFTALSQNLLRAWGKDPGGTKYSKSARKLIQEIDPLLSANDRLSLYAEISETLETQKDLSDEFKKRVFSVSKDQLEASWKTGSLIEGILEIVKEAPEARLATLEFLTNPFTEHSVNAFADEVEEILGDQADQEKDRFTHGLSIRDFVKEQSRPLWENYWNAPFFARAVFLEQSLFPDDDPKTFDSGKQWVLSKLFPKDEPYSKEARQFVEAYFRGLPEYQRRSFLSAAIVAAEKAAESENTLSIGERLALVLELLGPAETKVGQAAHSHYSTPEVLRPGLKRLKSKADPPYRWDLMQLDEQQVPHALRNKIKRRGALLGSASYYIVYRVEMKKGPPAVLAVLRPHSLERSRRGFDLLVNMLKELEHDFDPDSLAAIREMVEEAKERASIETDSRIGAVQSRTAVEIYDGQKIQVGEKTFTLRVPKVLASGETYRLMEEAPGEHFNDLPEKTAAEIERKGDIAKAYLSFELAQIAKGGLFDRDRHGAQMRVHGDDIYIFDHGGLSLEEPTPQERRRLGEILTDAVTAFLEKKDPSKIISASIRERRKAGENVKHMVAVQQALLALSDFQKYVKPEEMLEVAKAVFFSGSIHSEVQEGMDRRADENQKSFDLGGFSSGKCIRLMGKLAPNSAI